MKKLSLYLTIIATSILNTYASSVYVQTSLDTDKDGKADLIYVDIKKPFFQSNKLPAIMTMSPYSLGGNSTISHNVDLDLLPQEGTFC